VKRLAPYAAVLAGVGFFACLGYFTYLARVSPTYPDPSTGLIVRMNDHGYYFYVRPWQGWLLNVGPLAFVGIGFLIAGIAQRRSWKLTAADLPRWLAWFYFAAFVGSAAYMFWRFP